MDIKHNGLEHFQDVEDEAINDEAISEELECSDSEEEEEPLWSQSDERGFLRALSAIKSGDPKIYDTEIKFYEESKDIPSTSSNDLSKASSTIMNQKMTLRDYERKLVLERGGRLSEDEDDEQSLEEPDRNKDEHLRNELKAVLRATEDDDDGEELLTKRIKSEEEKKQEEDDYYEWIKGGGNLNIHDEDLNRLKKRWSRREELDSDELFLRDYLLDKQYVNEGEKVQDDGTVPTYEEIIQQEEEEARAELFEHKYNFRFEEPDQDFIKQYPRTVTGTLRTTKKKRKRTNKRKMNNREWIKKIMSEPFSDDEDSSHGGFKYRSVPANDFGLSTPEILMADDKQLNAWASVCRVVAYRSNEEEERDIQRYKKKAQNIVLKEKVFRSPSPTPSKIEGENDKNSAKKDVKRKKTETIMEKKVSAKKAAGDVKLLDSERLRAYGVRTKRLKKQLNKKRMEARRQKREEAAAAATKIKA